MTVSSTLRKAGPFVGDSLTTVFPFTFKLFAKTELVVTRTVIATGIETTLTLDSDYSVALNADQNANPGGSITYPLSGTALPATLELTLTSNVVQSQSVTLTNGGGWFPSVVTDALDRLTILVQQLALTISRGLTVAISDTSPAALPAKATRALNFLAFDVNGDPVASAGGASTPVSVAMAAVVAAATLAAGRTALGVNTMAETLVGVRNRVINGDVRVDQVNEGAAVSVAAGGSSFGPDMWVGTGTGAAGVFSMQQKSTSPPAGYKNYLALQTTTADAAPAAGSVYWINNRIQGLNIVDFQLGSAGALQFTTSLQLRSSLTGTFSGVFINSAQNRCYPWTCAIGAANTWTPITVTVAGDTAGTWLSDTGIGLEFRFDLGSGATFRGAANAWTAANLIGVTGAVRLISTLNATLDITGLQIEKGAVATGFDYRHVEIEKALCQEYACVFGGTAATHSAVGQVFNTTQGTFAFRFPRPMRAVPTLSNTGAAGDFSLTTAAFGTQACNSIVISTADKNGARVDATVTAAVLVAGNATAIYEPAATSKLVFSARL